MSDKEFQSVIESINVRFDELEIVIEEGFKDLSQQMNQALNPPGYRKFPFNPMGYVFLMILAYSAVDFLFAVL